MKQIGESKKIVVSDRLYQSVRRVIQEVHRVVSRVANRAMVETYWRVGCLIVEDEQKGRRKAEYGKAVLKDLAARLTAEYGSGYDASNLRNMRLFYLAFPIRDALRHELSWTHYRSLMHVENPIARYSILKGNEKLFAVKYKTYLPDEETLRREIETQKELYSIQMRDFAELDTDAVKPTKRNNPVRKRNPKT